MSLSLYKDMRLSLSIRRCVSLSLYKEMRLSLYKEMRLSLRRCVSLSLSLSLCPRDASQGAKGRFKAPKVDASTFGALNLHLEH